MGRPIGGKNRKWTKKEKLKYVKINLEEHMSYNNIERSYGVPHRNIDRWVRDYLQNGEKGLEYRKKTGNKFAALHTSKNLTLEERLKLIIMQQEIEIERLKKGYQVKGDGAIKEFDILNNVNLQ